MPPLLPRRPVLRAMGLLALLLPAAAPANVAEGWPVAPRAADGGAPWRLGYLEGGQYEDYETITRATVRGLMALGWIVPAPLPDEPGAEPGALWRWMAENLESDYIAFVADAYYTAGNFDSAVRPRTRAALLDRLRHRGDLDLILAMGTWAGQDLRVAGLGVPVVVGSTSDPVAAGIIDSPDDSGMDHLHAKVEPDRYQLQVALFHDIIGFARLGIVHADTPEGRTYGGVDAVEEVAAERGFEVLRCHAPYAGLAQEEVEARAIACHEWLAPQVDAIYVTVHRGVTAASLGPIMAAVNAHGLPTFSMLGSGQVRRGVLMSIAQADFADVGVFHAETIARILNGASPRALVQRWAAPPKIALNLVAAERIGFDPPVDLLLASDEIYDSIEGAAE